MNKLGWCLLVLATVTVCTESHRLLSGEKQAEGRDAPDASYGMAALLAMSDHGLCTHSSALHCCCLTADSPIS